MLDTDTKNKIDAARDILVGKVPIPTSQVEQITIALIYKFMDDMDKGAVSLGGKASFFQGEYKKYSWSSIFDPKISGNELVKLYAEAIEKMNHNPNIPQLFRDIFKNAYLPYKDPETLKGFLKVINEFNYSHSEKLGDAYEYLLSILGSQGDAGQFRTPRHIIDFIVSVVDPQKTDKILDPACGTAGFLISAYKHILNSNKDKRPGDKLKPEERKKLINNFNGYDISPEMVKMSLVNMYLHDFSNPKIYEYDTLTSEERWNEYYNAIFANPPFMSPKGGIRPHKKFSIQANRSEVLFVDYICEHLTPNGKAGIIVPEGIIFQSGNACKQLRKSLVEKYLWAVVSLPAGVFNPYAGVKTSILLIDKELNKKSDNILFVKIENDGFDLGAQRRVIEKNDLTESTRLLLQFKESVLIGKVFSFDNSNILLVEKTKLAEKVDYNLSMDRYRTNDRLHYTDYPLVKLGELMSFEYGKPLKEENRKNGQYPVFGSNGIVGYHDAFLVEGPFIIVGRKGTAGAVNYSENNGYPIDTTFFIKIKDENRIDLKYAYEILKALELDKVNVQAGVPGLNRNDAYEKLIPLPPLSIQQEIVAKIKSYQAIINGAKQVVDNYKPQIDIDTEWEIIELGEAEIEIIDGDRGVNYPKKEDFKPQGFCLFLNTKNVRQEGFLFHELDFISEEVDNKLRKGKLSRNDVVLTTRGTLGNVAVYDSSVPYENIRINSGMLIFRPNLKKINPYFLFKLFQSEYMREQFFRISSGSAQPQLPIRSLVNSLIPIPPLDKQIEIVGRIENEQKLIDANKELIKLYEQKIKDEINKVWEK